MQIPDKDEKFPLAHYDRLCFLKNIITNPNIEVGDYTYYDDFEDVANFEKNVAPYTIVGSNPAREIRKRFSTEKIAELLALKWWDWDIKKITENLEFLTSKTS